MPNMECNIQKLFIVIFHHSMGDFKSISFTKKCQYNDNSVFIKERLVSLISVSTFHRELSMLKVEK
jgi:hypothetical protein